MVLPFAIGAITPIIPMLVHPMATTARPGLVGASLLAQVPGMAGAGVMDGAVTAIAAATDIAVVMDSVADTATGVDTAVDTVADMPVAITADTAAASVAQLLRVGSAEGADTVADSRAAAAMSAVVVVSTAAVAAASTVVAADIAKT